MKISPLLKALRNKLLIASLPAFLTLGCGVPDRTEENKVLTRFLNSATFSGGTEWTDVDKIQIPKEYGNIPPHPDDLHVLYGPDHPCKTREVNLRSGEYTAGSFSAEVSPIPYDFVENIRVGYKGTFIHTDQANHIRDGLSDMEWYEYGAYAGTYSRIKMPNTCHSLRFSWRQPLKLRENIELFIQPGISYDMWSGKFEAQGGWDRYYREQPMLRDSFSAKSLWNPFIKAGIMIYDKAEMGEIENFSIGLDFFWESERIEGETPYGPVEASGETWGIEGVISF